MSALRTSARANADLPVLVLDEGSRGEVGLVRALGSAGIPVQLASFPPSSPTRSSRHVDRVHPVPGPGASDDERIEALRRVSREIGGRPPVMTASDGSLELLSRRRQDLEDVLRHDLAPAEVIATIFEKDRFAAEARRLDLPVPETRVVRSMEDVRGIADELGYPVFVKPFTKEAWGRLPEDLLEARKGQRVASPSELEGFFAPLARQGAEEALVQEYVSSPDTEHYSVHAYVLPDGRFAGAFTTRKIRVCPPHRGVGSLVVSLRVPRIVELSREILSELGYRGFALLQFKRDLATGRYLLLEINCRYSTSGELAARCGANFPALAYSVLTDGGPVDLDQVEDTAWIDVERDWAAFREYRRRGEWGWAEFLCSLRHVRYGAFLAPDDPGPFVSFVRQRLRRKLRPPRERS